MSVSHDTRCLHGTDSAGAVPGQVTFAIPLPTGAEAQAFALAFAAAVAARVHLQGHFSPRGIANTDVTVNLDPTAVY